MIALLWVFCCLTQGMRLNNLDKVPIANGKMFKLNLTKETGFLIFEHPQSRKGLALHYRNDAPRIEYDNIPKTVNLRQGDAIILLRPTELQDVQQIKEILDKNPDKEFSDMVILARELFADQQILLISGKEQEAVLAWRNGLDACVEALFFAGVLILFLYTIYTVK